MALSNYLYVEYCSFAGLSKSIMRVTTRSFYYRGNPPKKFNLTEKAEKLIRESFHWHIPEPPEIFYTTDEYGEFHNMRIHPKTGEFVRYYLDRATEVWNEEKFDELCAYYEKHPIDLAVEYSKNTANLSEEEKERLIHEASEREMGFLADRLPPKDPVINKIYERFKIPL